MENSPIKEKNNQTLIKEHLFIAFLFVLLTVVVAMNIAFAVRLTSIENARTLPIVITSNIFSSQQSLMYTVVHFIGASSLMLTPVLLRLGKGRFFPINKHFLYFIYCFFFSLGTGELLFLFALLIPNPLLLELSNILITLVSLSTCLIAYPIGKMLAALPSEEELKEVLLAIKNTKNRNSNGRTFNI